MLGELKLSQTGDTACKFARLLRLRIHDLRLSLRAVAFATLVA